VLVVLVPLPMRQVPPFLDRQVSRHLLDRSLHLAVGLVVAVLVALVVAAPLVLGLAVAPVVKALMVPLVVVVQVSHSTVEEEVVVQVVQALLEVVLQQRRVAMVAMACRILDLTWLVVVVAVPHRLAPALVSVDQ